MFYFGDGATVAYDPVPTCTLVLGSSYGLPGCQAEASKPLILNWKGRWTALQLVRHRAGPLD